MRNAVIGLFPGQVLKDKDSGGGDGHCQAAEGAFTSSSPVPRGTQLGAEARAAELHLAWKCSGCCSHYLVKRWKV